MERRSVKAEHTWHRMHWHSFIKTFNQMIDIYLSSNLLLRFPCKFELPCILRIHLMRTLCSLVFTLSTLSAFNYLLKTGVNIYIFDENRCALSSCFSTLVTIVTLLLNRICINFYKHVSLNMKQEVKIIHSLHYKFYYFSTMSPMEGKCRLASVRTMAFLHNEFIIIYNNNN